jgi:hypothetical protein
MANLSSVKFKENKVSVRLEISKDEYKAFNGEKDMLILPVSAFDISLVTGSLGNSNRIMLPNKVMKRYEIETLVKNAPSKIVDTKKGKYLVIKLEGSSLVPEFKE